MASTEEWLCVAILGYDTHKSLFPRADERLNNLEPQAWSSTTRDNR